MKKYYRFFSLLLVAIIIALPMQAKITDEPMPSKNAQVKMPVCVGYTGNYENLYQKVSKNKIQEGEVVFYKIDSLANSLSYHTRNTTPFVYSPEYNMLGTVKRGYMNPDEADANKDNTKDNLFLRLSDNLGQTWSEPYLLYDQYFDQNGGARYPSMAFFDYMGEYAVVYTSSLVYEAAGTWNGYITGVYSESIGQANTWTDKCKNNGVNYDWGVSDAAIAANVSDGEFAIFAANAVTPVPGSLTDNGNIGYRRTVELNEATTGIPAQWASDKFYPVDDVKSRPNELVGLRIRNNGEWYMGVHGNFVVDPEVQAAKFGFSVSNDAGNTWSDFTIMPPSVVKDYGASLGIDPESCGIGYYSKDFTVLDNGDVYFAGYFQEYSSTKATYDMIHQVVAIKYEAATQTWTINKLADVEGLWGTFLNDDGSQVASSADIEIEISKTADESKLIAKWIDLNGVNWVTDSTYQYTGNDIWVAIFNVADQSWSDPVNITNDQLMIRDTHIPEIVPSTSEVPILGLHTIYDESDNYYTAFRQYLRKQWVLYTVVDLSGINSVENKTEYSSINSIYPNPASTEATVSISTNSTGNVQVYVTDLLGNIVANSFDGILSEGIHNIQINTNALPSGAYYVVIKNNNSTRSNLINVVK